MAELLNTTTKTYLSPVTSTGMLHQKCEPDTPKAIMREVKDEHGNLVARFELRYSAIKGMVEDVSFVEGKYGEQIQFTFASSGKSIEGDMVVSIPIKSPFGRSLLQKLPNIDFSKEMILRPYAFEDDSKKRQVGIAILQDGNKVDNYYYDAEKKEYKNGYPTMEKPYTEMSEDERDIYFAQVRQFLVKEAKKLNLPKKKMNSWTTDPVEYPTEEISAEDIPF